MPCSICRHHKVKRVIEKESENGAAFSIVKCCKCGVVQVHPLPSKDVLAACYEESYFSKRSDRGYDNYFRDEIRNQIVKVYEMNLKDAGFFSYEDSLPVQKSSLDVGCAAGYFIHFLKERGWNASGIEISHYAAKFGIEQLGVPIIIDDLLTSDSIAGESQDLVTLWASIEHLSDPVKILEKIYKILKPNGHLILSTCRYGWLAKLNGKRWRYLNVPEHLFYFSPTTMKNLCKESGFVTLKWFSYGSGFTFKKNSGILYRMLKKIADPLVKLLNQGDMMVFHLQKR